MKTLCNYLVVILFCFAIQPITTTYAQENIKDDDKLLVSPEESDKKDPTIEVFKQTVFADVNVVNDVSSYTLRYDLVLLKGKNFTFSGNVGFGLLDSPEIGADAEGNLTMPKNTDYIVPVEANVWFGNKKHHLEIGIPS